MPNERIHNRHTPHLSEPDMPIHQLLRLAVLMAAAPLGLLSVAADADNTDTGQSAFENTYAQERARFRYLDGDTVTDPTVAWPDDRQGIKMGTLTLTEAMPQADAACEPINFDPLVMADGIAATDDSILQFRSPAHAVSFGKRLSGK